MVRRHSGFFLGMLAYCVGVHVNYVKTAQPLTITQPFNDVQTPHFENPFPPSHYRKVYKSCMKLWHAVRNAGNQELHEEMLHQFNTDAVSLLIDVYNRIGNMLEHQKSCSHEDLEHLIAVMCVMHREYLSFQSQWLEHGMVGREIMCGAVLFELIEKMLEKRLA